MDSNKVKVKKESKNKIRVEFDRTPLKDRLKAKFLNFYFVSNIIVKLFRFVFLLGIAYVILSPYLDMIASTFMGRHDFVDPGVMLIPKNPTFEYYREVFVRNEFMRAFANSLLSSITVAVLQTFVCCFIAYGLAKYKFKGNNLIFLLVILTMVIPHSVLNTAMKEHFRQFDVIGILSFLSGGASTGIGGIDSFLSSIKLLNLPYGIALNNTFVPFIILSVTGLAFKNGLYIFMLRQFFRGIPDSLEESAYIDGSSDFKTFVKVIIPMSVPMMITVFLFAFCWQWTDLFYTQMFFSGEKSPLTLNSNAFMKAPTTLTTMQDGLDSYVIPACTNAAKMMLISPLIVLYVFLQRYLVEGIERSGLTAE